MTERVQPGPQLDWLLHGLVDRIPEIRCAIVLSGDGLLIGKSKDLRRDDAEHLSAVGSGMHSLARGAARHFPFAVAVNCFDGRRDCTAEQVRAALDLDPSTPVLLRDVRDRGCSKAVLLAVGPRPPCA